jgi:hypothetical protein
MAASSASSAYAEYTYESAFGGGGSANTPIRFGKEVKVTGLEFKNNQMALGQLYSPEIETFAYGKTEGKCSVEYVASNPWFLQSIFGTAVSASSTPSPLYTHTWNSAGSSAGMKSINSLAVKLGFDVETDYKRTAVGVVCPSLSIKMALNETVKVSQELIWGEETVNQTFSEPQGTELAGAIPYTFVHAVITSPITGSTLATVQSFDLNLNTNAELIYQMGNTDSADAYRKILEMTGKVQIVLKSSAFLEEVYGRSATANNLVVTLSNGLSGNSVRKIVLTFTGCSFSVSNVSGMEPGELLLEDVDFQCKHVTAVATNIATALPS